jgi:hypothetical protein
MSPVSIHTIQKLLAFDVQIMSFLFGANSFYITYFRNTMRNTLVSRSASRAFYCHEQKEERWFALILELIHLSSKVNL